MENLELAYESRGSRNYLSVKATDELSAFQAKMLENNQIPCLLPMRSRSMNGVYCLDYDITGMGRLVDALESRQIRGSKAKKMLWELLDGLIGTEEYFLTYAQCVLELDYIYLSDDEKIGLVYLPLKDAEITNQETIKELFQDLLVNYLTDENEPFFLDLLRYVNKREFSVPGLYKMIKDAVDMTTPVVPQTVVQQPVAEEKPKSVFAARPVAPQEPTPVATPEPQKPKSLFSKPEPKPAAPAPAPAAPVTPPPMAPAGFAIPGVGPAIPPVAPTPAKQEKKPLFSFSGGKKEKPAVPEANVPPMGVPMGGNVPPMTPPPAAPAPQKAKGGLFGKPAAPATPVMPAAPVTPMQHQAPMNAAPAADQWKGTVMMTNDIGGGKTIMMGMGGSLPCLRHAGNTINLDHFPFMLGKQNADYVISKGVISRTHATIVNKNGSYYIKDENSSNHTYVNGAQIPPFTECEIFSGDRIRLADEEMEFIVEG